MWKQNIIKGKISFIINVSCASNAVRRTRWLHLECLHCQVRIIHFYRFHEDFRLCLWFHFSLLRRSHWPHSDLCSWGRHAGVVQRGLSMDYHLCLWSIFWYFASLWPLLQSWLSSNLPVDPPSYHQILRVLRVQIWRHFAGLFFIYSLSLHHHQWCGTYRHM